MDYPCYKPTHIPHINVCKCWNLQLYNLACWNMLFVIHSTFFIIHIIWCIPFLLYLYPFSSSINIITKSVMNKWATCIRIPAMVMALGCFKCPEIKMVASGGYNKRYKISLCHVNSSRNSFHHLLTFSTVAYFCLKLLHLVNWGRLQFCDYNSHPQCHYKIKYVILSFTKQW